ncbi:dihydroxyacetone kinase family protein [Streptomyces sp. NPDC053431]|uniref:dihydroxyacetone kinase family protein n=1 Tax=Streptomyces sp. NPDC053431 TaxID=3365703 RepID=UPI0037D145A4
MKKLINQPRNAVHDMVEGLALSHPGLALLDGSTTVVRDGRRPDRVAVVSGGGSGHEPAHAGYVGPGMLTAAVCGDTFTSPSVDAVLDALRATRTDAGTLLIVKNYTGDRLNFGLASELARAEGIETRTVLVADDVALGAGPTATGRRGLAGTVLVHKVAGAAAEAGASLDEVAAEAGAVAQAVGTMGVALGSCTVPANGRPTFELGDGEIEWGLGIHGEPGIRRAPLESADELARKLLEHVVADRGLTRGDRVALLVNGLGGTPPMELSIVTRACVRWLAAEGFVLERLWTGAFLTALEMPGCSVSLLRVDDATLDRLDAPALAPAWPAAHLGRPAGEIRRVSRPATGAGSSGAGSSGAGTSDTGTSDLESSDLESSDVGASDVGTSGTGAGPGSPPALGQPVEAVCRALVAAEPELTAQDAAVGDGDLGQSLLRAAEAIRRDHPGYGAAPAEVLRGMAASVRTAVGGTSGPLYAVLLLRAAAVLEREAGGSARPPARVWARALTEGAAEVGRLGGASLGDRTMLDALVPAAEAFRTALTAGTPPWSALRLAAEAAEKGAAATASLTPRLGRSSYLGERALGHPDPGATAVARWLAALSAYGDREA